MVLTRIQSDISVVEAARIRTRNIFENHLPVYFSFSGGKDSLALAQVVLELIQRHEIDPSLLTVQFIDEEAIFPCIEDMVKKWRKIFLMQGAKFEWYAMPVRHYNCFNELENDESFICFEPGKEDRWVRQPPSFAIRLHPLLKPGVDTYQSFLEKRNAGGIAIIGMRVAESLQRLQYFARITKSGKSVTNQGKAYPIYDWKDTDVWKFLKDEHVDIPVVYLYLYQIGTARRNLRISQFFSVDTARVLVRMNEYYPDLMERICRREPNAYLASLYWDSEMFGRSTRTRRELEKKETGPKKDYKAELTYMFSHMETFFQTPHKMHVATEYKKFFMRVCAFATEQDYKAIYEGLSSGDPKLRTLRSLFYKVYGSYLKTAQGKEVRTHGRETVRAAENAGMGRPQ